jgi:DNA-binding MarR family transcriptional regulator
MTRPSDAPPPPGTPHGDWLRDLVPSLRDLVRAARDDRLYARVARDAGVRVPAHLVFALTRIGDFQPVRLSDLADQMGAGRTTVSRQVADLAAAGLVTRTPDPRDKRAATLALTPAGDAALRGVWESWALLPGLLARLATTLEAAAGE